MNNQNHLPAICVSNAGLAAGTTTTYTRGNAVNGSIRGKAITELASASNTATPTTDWAGNAFTALPGGQDAGRTKGSICVFVFCAVAAGTHAVVQGPVLDLEDENDGIKDGTRPQFPAIDDTLMPFGYVIVKALDAASAWTFGASNWTATGIEDTYVNVHFLPDRPDEP